MGGGLPVRRHLAGVFAGEPPLALAAPGPAARLQSSTDRSAEFGFLPDPLWPHLGYLLGLVLLVGVGLLGLAARGSGQGPPAAPVLAAVLAGVVLVAAGGVGVAPAARLVVLGLTGPTGSRSEVVAEGGDRPWSYPDDGHARACAGDATLTACVYPAYGQGLAQVVRDAVAPVAVLFAGLPGVPTRVRMVPSQDASSSHSACRGTEPRSGTRRREPPGRPRRPVPLHRPLPALRAPPR